MPGAIFNLFVGDIPLWHFFMNKEPRKEHVSSLLSFCINISLTYLLLSPQHFHLSFRYGGEKCLDW